MKKLITALTLLCLVLHIIVCCLYISAFFSGTTGQTKGIAHVDERNEVVVFENEETDEEKLIGKWEAGSESLEFCDDGTVKAFEDEKLLGEGTWKIAGGEIIIDDGIQSAVFEYELKNNVLILYNDVGDSWEFVKK